MTSERAMGMRAVALAAALAAAGCGPDETQKVYPRLVVACPEQTTPGGTCAGEPPALDYGQRPVLNDLALELDVSNLGGAPLEFTRVATTGDDAFALKEGLQQLDRGAQAKLVVVFTPKEKREYAGKLVLDSNDLAQPHLELALHGVGSTAAAALVEPRALDFGRVGENRAAVKRVRITSTGTAPLKIRTLALKGGSSPAYGFIGSVRTPLELAAHADGATDDFAEVTVKFAPTSAADGTGGTLVVETTDPDNALVEIPLTASINLQPLAVAGADRDVAPTTHVVLDGSGSSDPDNDLPLAFKWTLVQLPQGSTATLADAETPTPSITPDLPGGYAVELVVTDGAGLSSKASRVRVNAVTSDKLVVELVWNHPLADLDLHFLMDGNGVGSARDCSGENPDPDFGVPGDYNDDPHHGGDKLSGFGPEWVVYEKPADGRYQVVVSYRSANGDANKIVPATLRVYEYGVVVREAQHTFGEPGQTWNPVQIDWPSGAVTLPAGGTP